MLLYVNTIFGKRIYHIKIPLVNLHLNLNIRVIKKIKHYYNVTKTFSCERKILTKHKVS